MDHQVLELVGERVAIGFAREVTRRETGPRDRVDHAVDHLLDAPLPRLGAELPAEVLRGHDVGRGLRPELRDLDPPLLEDVPAFPWDHRVTKLPLDLVVGVDPLAGEPALDPQAPLLDRACGTLPYLGDCHVRAPL